MRIAAVLLLTLAAQAPARAPNPPELARLWDAEHVSSPVSPLVDHAEVKRRVAALGAEGGELYRIRQAGTSIEGREIWQISFGTGPFVVMLWSQMHGDEPTATSALFDVYEYVRRHRDEPSVRQLLGALTVHTVPMLNPDGAERFQRRNAQGIDINRDALLLQTPEGRLLKTLRDELKPRVGLNLHNQGWNTTAGTPPKGAAISLLSVAFDEPRTVDDGRLLTKKLGAVVRDALEPFAAGRIGKYDDSFEVRAFGDNLTKWGTPILLIETGPWPEPNPDPTLVRLNYIAILRSLHALTDGSVHAADPGRYDSLPENDSLGFHTIIRNVTIHVRQGIPPFKGDVGISATRRVRMEGDTRRLVMTHAVQDLGDLRTYGALFEVDGTDRVLVPLVAGAEVGQELELGTLTGAIAPGAPADLLLLVPASAGRYRVERIFRAQQEPRNP